METNKVELIGRINHKEIKEHTNCKVAKLAVAKKIRNDEYKSFWVTLFDDEAVKAYQTVNKGDYAYIRGKLSVSTYVVNEKPIDKLEIIGYEVKKVKYDTDEKKYVEVSGTEGLEDWE